ncbi:hypothetical protein AB0J35_31320 [Nonomuraea angiospora]|uniref:hypothetical protein n=1 Tax=Nonomuraea angiospora TaxID=46172 RepID=UPI003427BD93
MPARRGLLRVVWLPGSDLLQGTCHCGAAHVAEGPVEVWEWLLGHPTGHTTPTAPTPPDAPTDPACQDAPVGSAHPEVPAGTARPRASTGTARPRASTGAARSDVLPGTGAVR